MHGSAVGTLTSALGLVGGLPSSIGMLVIWPIANRFGKKNILFVGCIIALAGGLAAFVNVHSFGIVCLGVVDHMEAKNGFRSDGFTMVIYAGLAGLCNGI